MVPAENALGVLSRNSRFAPLISITSKTVRVKNYIFKAKSFLIFRKQHLVRHPVISGAKKI
jgi:hypothetical protein